MFLLSLVWFLIFIGWGKRIVQAFYVKVILMKWKSRLRTNSQLGFFLTVSLIHHIGIVAWLFWLKLRARLNAILFLQLRPVQNLGKGSSASLQRPPEQVGVALARSRKNWRHELDESSDCRRGHQLRQSQQVFNWKLMIRDENFRAVMLKWHLVLWADLGR